MDVQPVNSVDLPRAMAIAAARVDQLARDEVLAHEGTLPFEDRLRIENERLQRAREEAEHRLVTVDDARVVEQPPKATEYPSLPEPAPRTPDAREVVQRVITQSVTPGSLLDVFA